MLRTHGPTSRADRVGQRSSTIVGRGRVSKSGKLITSNRLTRRCSGPACGGPLILVVRRLSRLEWLWGDLVRLRAKTIVGALFLLAGTLVVADGLVSGPHAFGFGWYSVAGIVLAGLLLLLAGASILREMRWPV